MGTKELKINITQNGGELMQLPTLKLQQDTPKNSTKILTRLPKAQF